MTTDKIDKYFGKKCRICGNTFGLHGGFTFSCPNSNNTGFTRTHFKFGRFRKEFASYIKKRR